MHERVRSDAGVAADLDGIAIVGFAGRFPGASSVEEYWVNLRRGAETLTRFSDADLEASGVSPEQRRAPDYVPVRGFIADADRFDASAFGMTQREAEMVDPQQRVFLESCWHALEHAAVDPHSFDGAIGVWGGIGAELAGNTYLLANLVGDRGRLSPEDAHLAMLGNAGDFLATRVAYKLNLRGPALSVQTACSTSLVAVVHAVQALLTGQCDVALAGGVSIGFPQRDGYLYQEGGIASPDGHCRPFDAEARGTVFSSGAGVVVLRRLDEAIAAGHTIYAVIRGAATNNDGAGKVSFAAPSVDGQADVIAMAHAAADVSPDSIDYVEAHGTATPLGDPIEVAALTRAFRSGGDRRQQACVLGSVKSNVGHMGAAAGVGGLLKAALALHHGVIPGTLHFLAPNPACELDSSPFRVSADPVEWRARTGRPRRAGVSAFGIGGTNAHVVLEEAPAQARPGRRTDGQAQLLVVSARTPAALTASSQALAHHLSDRPDVDLADAVHTLRVGRPAWPHRRAIVASSREDAIAALRGERPRLTTSAEARPGARAVAFAFPGGGAQHAGMGWGLHDCAPVFGQVVRECLAIAGPDLQGLLLPPGHSPQAPDAAALDRPSIGLPALFIVEYALARQWIAWGVEPQALIGHSVGEYAAACVAGVMSLEDAIALVRLRGRLFEQLPAGRMLAVPLPEAELRATLDPDLDIAAANTSGSCVVSGAAAAVAALEARLTAAGFECRPLHIDVAAHSRMVGAILPEFERHVRRMRLAPPQVPVVSNLTGDWMTADQAQSPEYWVRHLRETVRFCDGVGALLNEPNRVLLEVGPGSALTGFARTHAGFAESHVAVTSMRHPKDPSADEVALLQATGRLWSAGVQIDWPAFDRGSDRRRVALPTYPFERRGCIVAPRRAAERAAAPVEAASVEVDLSPNASPIVLRGPDIDADAPAAPVTVAPRRERIAQRIVDILSELSGLPAASIAHSVPFLEMGFDSLFLTQASLRFKTAFSARITFRQLFDDAPTIDALAEYLDRQLPPDALPPPVSPVPPPVAVVAGAQASSGVAAGTPAAAIPGVDAIASGGTTFVEQVVRQQLALMAEQLRLLGSPGIASVGPSPSPLVSPAASPSPDSYGPSPDRAPGHTASPAASLAAPASFGPFRAIDRSRDRLTAEQQAHVQSLVARYVDRTRGSKALTEAQRHHLADPRAVSGFRREWKEIVYQIAVARSEGCRVWDVDGHEYIDLTSSFGVSLFGFSQPAIEQAVRDQLGRGHELGTLSPLARDAADLICRLTGMERVTFANTGSEAIAGAIRAVRTATGRDWIAVFDEEYHGIAEEVLVRGVGSGHRRRAAPAAPGIPSHMVDRVLVLRYDDPGCLDVIRERAHELACVLIEPVQNRHPGYRPLEVLRAIREVTAAVDVPLVFDEMITGFRLHQRGAQGYFGIDADVACYGKIMSGGLPIAAIAGKARYLDAFDGGPWRFGDDSYPEGGVTFFGGTFTRNPLSLAASVAALRQIEAGGPDLQRRLNERGDRLADRLTEVLRRHDAPIALEHCGSILSLTYLDDNPLSRLLGYHLRLRGIHIWDRPFFLTTAHSDDDLDAVVRALDESLADMRTGRCFGEPPTSGPSTTPPARVDQPAQHEADAAPMTEAQLEVYLASRMSEAGSRAFHEIAAFDLDGPLDVGALEQAVADACDRHESLRMVVVDDPPSLRVRRDLRPELVRRDLSGLVGDERDAGLRAVLEEGDTTPMDLVHGPLVRWTLVRLDDAVHVLVVTVHHIVCDGWSMAVLMRDVAAIYSARVHGVSPTLAPAPRALDHAREERFWRESSAAGDTDAYWRDQFRTLPDPIELPADRPRPATSTFAGGRIAGLVDAELTSRLKTAAAEQGATLFVALLGTFELLLHRLSGQSEFVVGIPIAGQVQTEQPDLVAHCVQYVPLRCRVEAELTVREHFTDVRRRWLDANEHGRFTLHTLLSRLRLPRTAARNPLVSVSFTVEPRASAPAFAGLRVASRSLPRHTAKLDLHVNVTDRENGLLVEMDFNRDIFDEASVRGWLDAYRALLAGCVAGAHTPVAMVPAVSDAEANRMLVEWNQTAVSRPPITVLDLIEGRAQRDPDRIAVAAGDVELTYGALATGARTLAAALRSHGVGRDVPVGVCVDRTADMVVAVLGVLMAGGAYVPIDPALPAARVGHMVDDSGLRILVTHRGLTRPVALDALVTVDLDALPAGAASSAADLPLTARVSPDDLAYVIYTSGSTGRPKGVAVEHAALVNLVAAILEAPGFSSSDVLLAVSTLAFDIATLELLLPLAGGGRVVIASGDDVRDPRRLARLIDSSGATVMQATPATWRMLLESGWTGDGRLKVISGGEAMTRALAEGLLAAAGEVWNLYGPTETTIYSTGRRILDPDDIDIGRPIANTRAYVLDGHLQPVPVGVAGELCLAGVGLARGYHGRPDLTADRFVDLPFAPGVRVYRTGDRARWRPDGSLSLLGRADSQVKVRGYRIELGEVESAIRSQPGVEDVVVLRREDGGDARLVAYVRCTTVDPAALRDTLRQSLPEYMIPSRFVGVERWPLTPNGKIDRAALPAPESTVAGESGASGGSSGPASPRARTPVERTLAPIWEQLLQVPAVGGTDDFFLSGGHSLLAVRLIQRVHDAFGVALAPADLFHFSTFERLAQRIELSQPRAGVAEAFVELAGGGAGRPFFWVHGIGGEVFTFMTVARRLGASRPVIGIAADWTRISPDAFVTVEEMAAAYVAELRRRYPGGPYHLGGFCSGSLLALEMARQLEAAGEPSGVVVAVDWTLDDRSHTRSIADGLRNFPRWVREDAVPSGWAHLLGRLTSRMRRTLARSIGVLMGAAGAPVDVRDRLGMWRYPDHQVPMLEMYLRAFEAYAPKPMAGRLAAILPRTGPLLGPWYNGRDLGFAGIARGGVDVKVVPGSHSTMLHPAFVGALAAAIDSALEGATASSGGQVAEGRRYRRGARQALQAGS